MRRRQPAGERRAVERGAELEQVVVALRDLPEEEVGLGPDPGDVVRAQPFHPAREVLHDLGERVLAGLALLDRQPPPGGIDLEEAVRDVLADLDAFDPLVCGLARSRSHRSHGSRLSGRLSRVCGTPGLTGCVSVIEKRTCAGAQPAPLQRRDDRDAGPPVTRSAAAACRRCARSRRAAPRCSRACT